MTERTTVRLSPELLARAKRKAAAEGRTLTSLIEDGLRAVVSNTASPKKNKRRVLLPVSKATGGFRSGVNSLADIYEMEDAEYVEQMNRGYK